MLVLCKLNCKRPFSSHYHNVATASADILFNLHFTLNNLISNYSQASSCFKILTLQTKKKHFKINFKLIFFFSQHIENLTVNFPISFNIS